MAGRLAGGTVEAEGAAATAETAESAADAAQADGRTTGVAAELRVGDQTFTDVSTGGASRTLHPKVQEALDNVAPEQREPWHGHCAEPGCISKALNAGVDPAGGVSRAVKIRAAGKAAHATPKPACSSCRAVLELFGIDY